MWPPAAAACAWLHEQVTSPAQLTRVCYLDHQLANPGSISGAQPFYSLLEIAGIVETLDKGRHQGGMKIVDSSSQASPPPSRACIHLRCLRPATKVGSWLKISVPQYDDIDTFW